MSTIKPKPILVTGSHRSGSTWVGNTIKVFLLLAITTWIAHFWHSASFGLYEDDYGRVSQVMGITWLELWDLILNKSFGQGRPLHDGLIYLFSFLGLKLGGLHVVYWIGYAIVTINSFLFYLLLKRMFAKQGFAIIGALAFCLFPAGHSEREILLCVRLKVPTLFF